MFCFYNPFILSGNRTNGNVTEPGNTTGMPGYNTNGDSTPIINTTVHLTIGTDSNATQVSDTSTAPGTMTF